MNLDALVATAALALFVAMFAVAWPRRIVELGPRSGEVVYLEMRRAA